MKNRILILLIALNVLFLPGFIPLKAENVPAGKDKRHVTDAASHSPGDGFFRQVNLDAGTGIRISSLYSEGSGAGASPDFFFRAGSLCLYNILLMTEIGYYQNRFQIPGGDIGADFLSFSLLGGYSWPFYKRSRSSTGFLNEVSLYGYTGPALNIKITSRYSSAETGEAYSFDTAYRRAFATWVSGVGLDFSLWHMVIFVEASASLSLGKSIEDTASDIMQVNADGEAGFSLRLGARFQIIPW